ncbi:MAG: hypothetical protein HZA15_12335 [Nitrospirae bacterium]|nr:hypothetical protein [Nitrospirota bacterium]
MRNLVRCLPVFFMLFFFASFAFAHDVLVLKSADIKPYQEALDSFRRTCGCRTTEVNMQDLKEGELSNRIATLHVDAVFAIGSEALREAKSIRDIPVVHALTPVNPYSGPEHENISGVSMYISAQRQLEAMVRVFPGSRKIGCIYNEKNFGAFVQEAQQVADSLGLELVLSRVQSASEVPSRIDAMKKKIELFWMLPDVSVINAGTVNHLLLFSFENRLPVFSFSYKYVEQGAVAALIIDPAEIGKQSGELMHKILSSPIRKGHILQSPRKPGLVINRKVAAKLGIEIGSDIPEGPRDIR